MTSTRKSALDEILARLAAIRITNGYNTDAGARLFIGEQPVLGPSDPEASIAVVVREDEAGYQGENVVVRLPVAIQAIVKADAADPFSTVEDIIEDIKRAVETDHDLGGRLVRRGLERGSTQPLDRESGSEFIGAEVQYRLIYAEQWGAP